MFSVNDFFTEILAFNRWHALTAGLAFLTRATKEIFSKVI